MFVFFLAYWAAGVVDASAVQIKIMTYNIHQTVGQSAGYSSSNAQGIARIVNYFQPDVVAINELEGNNTTLAGNNLKSWINNYIPYLGGNPGVSYFIYVCPINDGFNMNALVSRYPIYGSWQSLDPRGLTGGVIDLPGDTDIKVYTCHLKAFSDSSSASRRQQGAATAAGLITYWSGIVTNADTPYVLCGDMNEDEDNPQTLITGSYHPISTLLTAYLGDFEPDNRYGNSKTISSSSPTRRFDYLLPSWNLKPVWGPNKSQVINTNQLFLHGQLNPPMQRWDSTATDHLCVLGTFELRENNPTGYKSEPDGSEVTLTGKTVSASFGNHFYVQESSTWSAIRVNSTASPSLNSIVNITGIMAGAGGERAVAASGVRVINMSGTPIKPLAMSNKSVGGADLNGYAYGVENPQGPNNVGILVRLSGRVESNFSGGFYLDDGSGFDVKVYCAASVATNNFVTATGVVGYEIPTGYSKSVRVLKTRTSGDLQTIAAAP